LSPFLLETVCASCRRPAAQLPPPRWWVAPDRLACSHACAAVLNELRRGAALPPIRWSYVDQPGEPRDSSVAHLSILLTLAHHRAGRFNLGPATPDESDDNQPTSAVAELRFLIGAAVVILGQRENPMRS
jgi:hypothetical protein